MANTAYTNDDRSYTRRVSTETKASFKTTELIAYLVAVVGVPVAAAIADTSDFAPRRRGCTSRC